MKLGSRLMSTREAEDELYKKKKLKGFESNFSCPLPTKALNLFTNFFLSQVFLISFFNLHMLEMPL